MTETWRKKVNVDIEMPGYNRPNDLSLSGFLEQLALAVEGLEDATIHSDIYYSITLLVTGWRDMNDKEIAEAKIKAERKRVAAAKAKATRIEKERANLEKLASKLGLKVVNE